MKKMLCLLLMIGFFVMPSISSADEIDDKKVKVEDFEITVPEKKNTFIDSGEMIISGVGKQDDKVYIDVYSVTTTNEKDKEKIVRLLIDSYDIDVNRLQVFAQDVQLKEGENNIVITLCRGKDKYKFTRVVNYDKSLNIIKTLDYKRLVK